MRIRFIFGNKSKREWGGLANLLNNYPKRGFKEMEILIVLNFR
jgi:hypothetical protein